MKYTRQLYYGEVNVKGIVSNNPYLKPATIIVAILAATFGLAIFFIAYVPAASMDLGRYVRLEYLRQLKIYHRVNYINEVTKSLTDDRNERNEACKLLISLI